MGTKIQPEKIHLLSVRVLKSRFELKSPDEEYQEIDSVTTGLKSESSFNFEEGLIRFRLFVIIKALDVDGMEMGIEGEYHVEFDYQIENLEDFTSKGNNQESRVVESILGATIAGISYSTARGIILNRTQATNFNGVLLPVINPADLLKEDTFTSK